MSYTSSKLHPRLQDANPPTFLGLAPETRNTIYALVFDGAVFSAIDTKYYKCVCGGRHIAKSDRRHSPLLLTCRTAYHEAIVFYYSQLRFRCDASRLEESPICLPKLLRQHVRHVDIVRSKRSGTRGRWYGLAASGIWFVADNLPNLCAIVLPKCNSNLPDVIAGNEEVYKYFDYSNDEIMGDVENTEPETMSVARRLQKRRPGLRISLSMIITRLRHHSQPPRVFSSRYRKIMWNAGHSINTSVHVNFGSESRVTTLRRVVERYLPGGMMPLRQTHRLSRERYEEFRDAGKDLEDAWELCEAKIYGGAI